MKQRFLLLVVVLLAAFVLAACGMGGMMGSSDSMPGMDMSSGNMTHTMAIALLP